MSDFDKRLKTMAGAEVCPVPEGFERRMEQQLQELTGTKVRTIRPVRWAVAAACLCVVLVGTAFAVKTAAEGGIRRYFSGEEYNDVMEQIDSLHHSDAADSYSGYVVARNGDGISMAGVSEEAMALSRQQDISKSFDDLAAAEAFLGVDLYDNAALEGMMTQYQGQEWTLVEDDGLTQTTQVETRGTLLMCSSDGEELLWFTLLDYYAPANGLVSARVSAEAIRVGAGEQVGSQTAMVFPEGTEFEELTYAPLWGGEVTIVRCDYPATEYAAAYTAYTAHFCAEGVRYQVTAQALARPEHGLELLESILDAFVFKPVA